jgi:hypothetical protein
VRASPPRPATKRALLIAGVLLLVFELCVVFIPSDGQTVFWLYALGGLPAMFLGYFLLGTPVLLGVQRVLGPALGRVLRLPPGLLTGTIAATPFRYGFTAGAMMSGLAIMVALWTQGRAIVDDWLAAIRGGATDVTGLLENPEYLVGLFGQANEVGDEVIAASNRSSAAGSNADGYLRTTLFMASALFFAGVVTSFKARGAKGVLLLGAMLLLALGAAQIVDLPVT